MDSGMETELAPVPEHSILAQIWGKVAGPFRRASFRRWLRGVLEDECCTAWRGFIGRPPLRFRVQGNGPSIQLESAEITPQAVNLRMSLRKDVV